ncbi:MAG: hypothetical protein WBC33_11975 [Conexibacter sp.]
MILASEVIDAGQLAQVVEAAVIAGIGVCIAFSLVIRGAVRADEHRQRSRPLAAGAYAVLATLALLACLGAIALGVSVMLSK